MSLCGYVAMIGSPDTELNGSTKSRGPHLYPRSYHILKFFFLDCWECFRSHNRYEFCSCCLVPVEAPPEGLMTTIGSLKLWDKSHEPLPLMRAVLDHTQGTICKFRGPLFWVTLSLWDLTSLHHQTVYAARKYPYTVACRCSHGTVLGKSGDTL